MGSKEMTKDDEKVERIASLAAYFMQARSAVSSEAIHTRFYPSLSVDSFNKAFSRDRCRPCHLRPGVEEVRLR